MTGGVMSADRNGALMEFYCGSQVTWQLMGDPDSRLMMEGEIKAIRITPPPLAVILDVNNERWLVELTELERQYPEGDPRAKNEVTIPGIIPGTGRQISDGGESLLWKEGK
jgi:hypothetical protein